MVFATYGCEQTQLQQIVSAASNLFHSSVKCTAMKPEDVAFLGALMQPRDVSNLNATPLIAFVPPTLAELASFKGQLSFANVLEAPALSLDSSTASSATCSTTDSTTPQTLSSALSHWLHDQLTLPFSPCHTQLTVLPPLKYALRKSALIVSKPDNVLLSGVCYPVCYTKRWCANASSNAIAVIFSNSGTLDWA